MIRNDVRFLTVSAVRSIHEMQILEYGGSAGIRDGNGLEAAVMQATQSFGDVDLYPSIFDKAAVYAYHIAESQAFVDGNKRTGLMAALTFLQLNGYELPEQDDRLYEAMINISKKTMSREALSALFNKLSDEFIA